jgi:hypothetical protein
MTENEAEEKNLVYGEAGGSLVFIPRRSALELANLRGALDTSKTWGELKSRISVERYEQIINPHFENFYDEMDMDVELTLEEAKAEFQSRKTNKDLKIGERAPEDSDAFDSGFVYGLSDGDWPEWPAQEMVEWVPEEIQEQFGRVVATRLNGDYLEFDGSKEAEIVAAFKELGYLCERDDVLVCKASGTSW